MRLIEASAGTGKTYNIVFLFLRTLLERDLDIGRILVVTFTNAATEELRGRLRERLREAADHFACKTAGTAGPAKDPLLDGLAGRLDPERLARAAWKLRDAAGRLDEAAIFTIHGFCMRMLQEFAFESGAPFHPELTTDEEELRRQAAADFWRRALAGAGETETRWFLQTWNGPDGLLQSLQVLRGTPAPKILPELQPEDVPGFDELDRMFREVRRGWERYREDVVDLFRKSDALNRRSYNSSVVQKALDAMDALAGQEETPLDLPEGFYRFTPAMLEEKGTKAGRPTPSHPFFDLCGRFRDRLRETSRLQRIRILRDASRFVEEETARRKEQEELLSFDDLLNALDKALCGPGGADLARRIRDRFPVALIDEFQDTDPVQYRIFQRIYDLPENPEPLCLIGDPKQAIYSFRGADIFAYMQARRDAGAGSIYTMDTNWRSASDLVEAVNLLFRRAPAPFVYDEDIPFHPVKSAGKTDARPLLVDGTRPAAFRIRFLRSEGLKLNKGNITKGDAYDAAAADCAGEIARLLNLAAEGRARIGDAPLKTRDIAVLVRSHREGDMVQKALRKRGIASVSLQRESVFSSGEAEEMLAILAALADPGDEGLLRAALATEMLGWDAPSIRRLDADEALLESLQQRFFRYHDLWRRYGFLSGLLELLKGEGVTGRVRSLPEGERRLTNILHLLELLHAASQTHPGTEKLLRWLQDKRASHRAAEEEQLRLESDENLVQVVTIHRSKGLEYPVVFVPFPWSGGPSGDGDAVRFHDPEDLRLCVDLGSDDIEDHRALQEREDLAERMRLLYVALTRAKHLCVTTWGKINEASRSAMARLLFPDPDGEGSAGGFGNRMDALTEEALREELAELAKDSGGIISLEDAHWETPERLKQQAATAPSLAARNFSRAWGPEWRITSYTNLVSGADPHGPDYDSVPADAAEAPVEEADDPVFLFPRGPRPGECLHEILENLDFPAAAGRELEAVVQDALRRHGLDSTWTPTVVQWMERVLDTPLNADGLKLRGIESRNRLDELEFHYSLGLLTPDSLAEAVRGEPFYERSLEGLGFGYLRGLMRGFIDLAFRSDGRYYIADYKSNHLGNRVEDYAADSLERAMHAHRYPLQVLVYTVALHRYLRARLPGYDYDSHFGGVFYLFLRGMRPETGPGAGVFFTKPRRDLVERLDRTLQGEADPLVKTAFGDT
ncbi:DNA helicase/exodeoxyribonuclease V, beta subunit [Desulfacinum infernum DSM 9756]|uniref:DNA 3'-5' helicase n=1 Tax=Desulfacinum infernum DSM 9756 TaxID=1121391 RepID=A0A1M5AEU8_9BACT|nr:DNA helicase/exodeoxyribonuclease V, beta subunit [Desulfacinum infernum DSM 9756]